MHELIAKTGVIVRSLALKSKNCTTTIAEKTLSK